MAARNYRLDPRRARLEQLAKIEAVKPIPAPGKPPFKNPELKNPIISQTKEEVQVKPTQEDKEPKKKSIN